MSHNQFQVIGNLIRDAEFSTSESGAENAMFDLATRRPWKNKDGSEAGADFFRVKTFNGLAENASDYLKKGARIFVQGRMVNTQSIKNGQTVFGVALIAEKVEYIGVKVAESTGEDAES